MDFLIIPLSYGVFILGEEAQKQVCVVYGWLLSGGSDQGSNAANVSKSIVL